MWRNGQILVSGGLARDGGTCTGGATENTGMKNAIRAKMQGWKCRSGKCGSNSMSGKFKE